MKKKYKFLSEGCQVAIDTFIKGKYEKFNSNTGYENPLFKNTIPAFSHFTWLNSKGKVVVMDVQGIHNKKKNIY